MNNQKVCESDSDSSKKAERKKQKTVGLIKFATATVEIPPKRNLPNN